MGKGSNTTSSTTTSSADPQAAAAYRALLERAQGVASTPYQAYTGELTAPINAQQQLGIGNINANANFAAPYINQAAGYATDAAQAISPEQIASYQNPYTQSVVDATQAQFNNQNQQAQQGLTSSAIAQGALGGNRTGVAAANLANQQQLAQSPVIAGLYSNSYQQALAAAQADQQRKAAAAYSLGNLGVAGQSAALSGAGAQLGAGTLQQQTQQAADTANYGQFTQAQAFPYQQTQWLAGLQTGVGSQLGGTSSGQTTAPAPNQAAQWAGLGLSAAGLFLSDARAKEDISKIGETNEGQPIYRYRYKGSPDYQIGLIAQDEEQRAPENVRTGVGGLKFIDLKGATDEAAGHREKFASGGVAGTPWSEGQGWIPDMKISGGRGAPSGSAPSAPSGSQGAIDPQKIISQAMGLAGKVGNGLFSSSEMGSPGVSSPLSVIGAAGDYAVPTFMARGGGVAGFAGGGAPDDVMNGDPAWGDPANPNLFAVPDAAPSGPSFADRFAPAEQAIADGTFDPQGANYTTGKASPMMVAGDVPLPRPRPDDAPVMAQDDEGDSSIPAAARPAISVAPSEAAYTPRAMAYSPEPDEGTGLVGMFGKKVLNRAQQAGVLGLGLGLLSSRSPNLGNAIGDAGQAGLAAYAGVKKGEQEQAKTAAQLSQQADKIAADIAHRNRQQTETERHNKATENAPPKGFELDENGKMVPIPGGPADPDYLARAATAKKGPGAAPSIDDDTIDLLAERVMAGDTRALIGFGRGAQGAENIAAVQKRVAEKARANGTSVGDAARTILSNAAQNAGYLTASRRQATIMANLSVYGRTAFRATDLAEAASDAVPRTEFQPINKALNAYRTNTGDPKIVALGAAVNSLVNEYARAISGGRPTVNDKVHAEEMLSRAQSPEQFRAVINMMRQELVSEERAMPEAKKHIEDIYNPSSKSAPHSVADRPGAKAKGAQPKRVIQNGYTYELGPDGKYHPVQ